MRKLILIALLGMNACTSAPAYAQDFYTIGDGAPSTTWDALGNHVYGDPHAFAAGTQLFHAETPIPSHGDVPFFEHVFPAGKSGPHPNGYAAMDFGSSDVPLKPIELDDVAKIFGYNNVIGDYNGREINTHEPYWIDDRGYWNGPGIYVPPIRTDPEVGGVEPPSVSMGCEDSYTADRANRKCEVHRIDADGTLTLLVTVNIWNDIPH